MNHFRLQIRSGHILAVVLFTSTVHGATITECQQMLQTGQYAECLAAATEAIERRSYGEEWPILKAQAETTLGKYPEASATIAAGLERYAWSVRLRMLAHANFQILGEHEKAQAKIDEINTVATASPWRYTDADDLVALGNAAIVMGADPKDVLEGFFDRARRNYSSRPEGYIAAGQLALNKGDFALAAELLRPAAEKFPQNPDVLFALSEAVRSGAPEESADLLQQTLAVNSNHLPALQRIAERQIDAEDYATAVTTIDSIHAINPWHPEAHALRAVIHHLQNQPEDEAASRAKALHFSENNPAVDSLIGEKLSRKYRFAEAADYLRKALRVDPYYLPAKTQLSQDLLRLGMDAEGWKLADDAQRQDKYSTTLFNLMQLKDTVQAFTTLENEHFVIRMERSEAAVYGNQVQALLNEAMDVLSQKYGYTPDEPVVVEIFNRPDDFAVRTFGMPDVAGFLGVCFGKLITANSPASMRNSPSNWNSVLWHEFCHVITLQMTGNKIPRWLSEGISVYEERVRDSRWGQSMSPEFRARVLEDNVTPVSDLSSAFLKAKSGADLNFAYYESSMVVDYIVREHGFEALQQILKTLKEGFTINDALDRHAGGLPELESGFAEYLRTVANEFAPDVQFTVKSEGAEISIAELEAARQNPANYSAGLHVAADFLKQNDLTNAEKKLLQLIELYPEDPSPNGARPMLALVYRRQGKTEQQVATLTEHLQRSAEDLSSAMELLSLHVAAENWGEALKVSRLVDSIDPLRVTAVRQTLTAALAASEESVAVSSLKALLELDPADAARTHFQLARLLQGNDTALAKRHVLLALEQAPRYRDAHKLLLRFTEDAQTDSVSEQKKR
ncbi:MAG: peptidase MA family metallohydrolase [Planctomycetaceae bacterium]